MSESIPPTSKNHTVSDRLLRIYADRGSADSQWMAREIFRLRDALDDYGQHQQKSCLDLPATENKFCYCGLNAARNGERSPDTIPHVTPSVLLDEVVRQTRLVDEYRNALRGLMPEGWDDPDGHMDHMPGIKTARLLLSAEPTDSAPETSVVRTAGVDYTLRVHKPEEFDGEHWVYVTSPDVHGLHVCGSTAERALSQTPGMVARLRQDNRLSEKASGLSCNWPDGCRDRNRCAAAGSCQNVLQREGS